MSGGRGLRALLRVEARQLLSHRGRSLLLVALVAVPVAAIVGGATLLRIAEPTADERAAAVVGAATLRVALEPGPESAAHALRLLPAGARSETIVHGTEQMLVPGRRLGARLVAAAPGAFAPGGLARGQLVLVSGRAPANPGEVALSPVLLEGLGRAPGGLVTLAYGGPRVITGVVLDPEAIASPLLLRTPAIVEDRVERHLLVALPLAAVAARAESALTGAGFAVASRAESARRGETVTAVVYLIGTLGFVEAALVIAAAFTVSLRRRRREIGLLGSVGATPRRITGAMIGSGALLGTAGALLGAAVGLAAAAAVHPFLDGWTGRRTGSFEAPLEHVLAAALLGVAATMAAVALPAWHAARLPVREALGGRRPVTAPPRRLLAAGIAFEALAVGLLVLVPRSDPLGALVSVIGGSVLCVVGFGALSPWLLVALARRAEALPLVLRLAVRDAGRAATRNGPVVTAVLAGMAMSVTLAVLITSVESKQGAAAAPYRDDQLLVDGPAAEAVARRLAADLGAVALAPLAVAYGGGMPIRVRAGAGAARRPDWIAAGDERLLRVLDADAGAGGAAFRGGALLALGGGAPAESLRLLAGRAEHAVAWPLVARVPQRQNVVAPAYVVSAAALEARGLTTGPPPRRAVVPWLVRLPVPVSGEVLARAQAAAADAPGTTIDATLLHRRPGNVLYAILLAACFATGLVVVLVATALAAVESAADERVLHTLGASPALERRLRATRAAYLALLGCALAVPAGMLPAMGLLAAANFRIDFVVPWRDLAIVLLGLPPIAYAVAWSMATPTRAGRALAVVLMLALLPAAASSATQTPAPAPVRWEPYVGKATDGTPIEGRLGRIRVPERRDAPTGRTIEIAFVRYRTTHPSPGPPLVFLEGGPGGSGVAGAAWIATHPFLRGLESRDVIGIDQRGTGLSRPILDAPGARLDLPLDRVVGRAEEAAAFRAAGARALAWARARGVDLAAYDTNESADDVEAVRRALALPPVVVYGGSYGSHLGLALLRRHPGGVARAVLAKVEGPDDTWKLPSTTQHALERLHAQAALEPSVRARVPDVLAAVRRLLARLERTPLAATAWPGTKDAVRVILGAHDLRCALADALGSTRRAAGIPRLLDELARGDGSELAGHAVERRRAEVGPVMGLLMDCASGASAPRRARIRREAADPANLLSDAMHAPFYDDACRAWGVAELDDDFRAPFTCAVPTLFVSGEMDARTPPENVAAIRPGFERAIEVRAVGTAHDPRELVSEEYRALLQAFLRGEPVASCRLELPFHFEPFAADSADR